MSRLPATKDGLIFTTRYGRAIEPGNLLRSFHRICDGLTLPGIILLYLCHIAATLRSPESGYASHSRPRPHLDCSANLPTQQRPTTTTGHRRHRYPITGCHSRRWLPSDGAIVVEDLAFISVGALWNLLQPKFKILNH
jgi:hypothetical protein